MNTEALTLTDIKSRWNQVLDRLLEIDRIIWLAFFDARLADYGNETLTLDYQDSQKLAHGHDFSRARKPEHVSVLEKVLWDTFHCNIRVIECD